MRTFERLRKYSESEFIEVEDLQKFLTFHKVIHNKFEIKCLVSALDTDNDEKISYNDFIRTFLPKSVKIDKQVAVKSKKKLEVDIEYALVRFLQKELEMHRELEGMKAAMLIKHKVELCQSFFCI